MKGTRVVKDATGTVDLCETFTDNKDKKLLQMETGAIFFSPVVDIIAGYKKGKPYPPYTYVEVNKAPEDYEQEVS